MVQYGILNYGIREVTVNEQNPQAVGFYKHLGFETYKKTERDEEEKGLTTTGWIRNIYPTRKTAEDALERNDLFVMVLHALAVDPYQKIKVMVRHLWHFMKIMQNNIIVLHCVWIPIYETQKQEIYIKSWDMKKLVI